MGNSGEQMSWVAQNQPNGSTVADDGEPPTYALLWQPQIARHRGNLANVILP